MRGVGGEAGELLRHILARMAVNSQQGGAPGRRRAAAYLLDHRRPVGNVAGVVEDGVAEQNDVAHDALLSRPTSRRLDRHTPGIHHLLVAAQAWQSFPNCSSS